jgi:hypothetical protein
MISLPLYYGPCIQLPQNTISYNVPDNPQLSTLLDQCFTELSNSQDSNLDRSDSCEITVEGHQPGYQIEVYMILKDRLIPLFEYGI